MVEADAELLEAASLSAINLRSEQVVILYIYIQLVLAVAWTINSFNTKESVDQGLVQLLEHFLSSLHFAVCLFASCLLCSQHPCPVPPAPPAPPPLLQNCLRGARCFPPNPFTLKLEDISNKYMASGISLFCQKLAQRCMGSGLV